MNNLKKVGLTALAASLATVSAHAGELSVSGSASLGWTSIEKANSAGWYMNDKITFSGSGTLDNGLELSMGLSIDESDAEKAADSSVFEGRFLTLSSDTLGSLTFQGKDGTGVIGAYDDKMPTIYEETWYAAGTSPTDGPNTVDTFYYSNSTMDGVQIDVSYTPGGSEANQNAGSLGYAAVITAVDGLTVGIAAGEDESLIGRTVDNTIMYATYAYGPVTVGYQVNEADSTAASSDQDFTAAAITYAVNDDLSVMVSRSETEKELDADDQKITSFGASYSMGSMSVALQTWDVKNNNHSTAANDSYRMNELNIAFAF